MAFHDGFWVAISTVAPVIALATIVALPDGTLIGRAQMVLEAIQDRQPSPEDQAVHVNLVCSARNVRKWAWIAWLATLANLIIQAGLLAVSLSALASEQDITSFWLAICPAAGGVLLLAWTNMVSVQQRWSLERGLFGKGGFADAYLKGTLDSYLAAKDSANPYLAPVDSQIAENRILARRASSFPPAPGVGVADELAKLAQLRDSGVMTDEEFAKQKASLLD